MKNVENIKQEIDDLGDPKGKNDVAIHAAENVSEIAIKGMSPADKGWMLAAVVLILGAIALIEVTNYLEVSDRIKSQGGYFTNVETNRSEEFKRLQNQNKYLIRALSKQTAELNKSAAEVSRRQAPIFIDLEE